MSVYEGVNRKGNQVFFSPRFGVTHEYTPQRLAGFARYTFAVVASHAIMLIIFENAIKLINVLDISKACYLILQTVNIEEMFARCKKFLKWTCKLETYQG